MAAQGCAALMLYTLCVPVLLVPSRAFGRASLETKRNEARIILGKRHPERSQHLRNGGAPLTFSVVVPVFNGARRLRDCLDSLLAQTHVSWECICVDDCSVDLSREILGEYARRDARLTVIRREKCGGTFAALNDGLSAARGDYVLFAGSADVLPPRCLEIADILARATGAGLLQLGAASHGVDPASVRTAHELFVARDLFDRFLLRGHPLANTFYRRTAVADVLFDPRMGVLAETMFGLEMMLRINEAVRCAVGGCRHPGLCGAGGGTSAGEVLRFVEALGRWYATGAGRFSLCGALPFVRERVRAQINYLTMGLFKTNVERVSPTRSIA